MSRILLVDDDPQALESTRKILQFAGHEVTTAMDGQAALETVRPSPGKTSAEFDLIITDVRMPRLGGLEFLRALSLCGKRIPVILMTAFGRVEDAVWAMKLGAVDFLTKPFKRQSLLTSIETALKRSLAKNSEEPTGSTTVQSLDLLLGRSQIIESLKDLVRRVAPTQATVLLTGESGTGKELVARCIHLHSSRPKKPFVAINCAAVPEQLLESELFGFEKGAFTGASAAKEGLFEAANGGTLLLDEIGDMPYSLQAKLLRTLQESEVRRLGSTVSKKIDVRVVAATHRDLKQAVQEQAFRQDLLYRLEVIGIHIPALRERPEDIPELAYHFLKTACRRHVKEVNAITDEALEALVCYEWPGNVRELSNVLERAVILTNSDQISITELPSHLLSSALERGKNLTGKLTGNPTSISVPLGTSLKEVEELLIRKTLEATDGDKNMTAKLLGINSRTIYRKLDKKAVENEPETP